MKQTSGRFVPPDSIASAPRTANAPESSEKMVANVLPKVAPSTRSGTTSPPTKPASVERSTNMAFSKKE